jgi:hypothetical protein
LQALERPPDFRDFRSSEKGNRALVFLKDAI